MLPAPKISNEIERLEELSSYCIINTQPEAEFDTLTNLASQICGTKVSLITFIEEDRQWMKSNFGIDVTETPREISFCQYAINQPDEVMVVPDARIDERFKDSPLVIGEPHVVFYAGIPLVSKSGHSLGTLCVIDFEPKKITEQELEMLRAIGRQANELLELRKLKLEQEARKLLEEETADLGAFAFTAAHDIKSPLVNILSFSGLMLDKYDDRLNPEVKMMIDSIHNSASRLMSLVDGILDFSRLGKLNSEDKTVIEINPFLDNIRLMLPHEVAGNLRYDSDVKSIFSYEKALFQLLLNLFNNSIQYSDKEIVDIHLEIEESDLDYQFRITDNGAGIDPIHRDKIFKLFEVIGKKASQSKGNGIGLATVKKLVEAMNGEIELVSQKDEGASFQFTIKK